MATCYIAGASRDVIWSEERDAGDMFTSEVGVWRDPDGRFRAFVKDGWGGGMRSKPHPDETTARADVPRLWEQFYG
jgi:hypothetical protein